ncbi:MAG TPA: four helix bundle protein [Candidatus Peribacteraceae bacterium]|nr:four helix bundle protein [Candidatus Peribacteraceae bacterium]
MMQMSFKHLLVWNKSMDLAFLVYEYTKNFPKSEMFGLQSQMRRSAVSVVSNIAEGSQLTSDKQFAKFILTSKGSLAELETQRLISLKMKYLSEEQAEDFANRISELDKMLYGLHRKLAAASL